MFKFSYLAALLLITPCWANEIDYQQCLQDYLPKAEIDEAAQVVKQRCGSLHSGDIMLPREKARLQCQLESAATAKTGAALDLLLKTCNERHSFKNHQDE